MRVFRDGVLRGVKKFFNPRSPDPLIDQADQLLARFPVSEDGKFQLHHACEEFLAAFRRCRKPSADLSVRAAKLLARLHRHPEALAVVDAIPRPAGDDASELAFYRAELAYLAGDIASAERHFAGLDRLQLEIRPSWKRSHERFLKHKRALQRKSRAQDLYAALAGPDGPDLAALRDVLAQGDLPADRRAYFQFIHDRVAHVAAASVLPEVPVAPPSDVRPVFACGFGWSGSGAVSAFLSQSTAACLPFGHSELAHLQGRNKVRGIKPFLRPRKLGEPAMRLLLVEFICRTVGTFGDSKDSYSLYPFYDAAVRGRLGVAVDALSSAMLSAPCLQERDARGRVLARFVLDAMDILSPGRRPVLNNVFMAANVALAASMPEATFVIVKRDVRDQYVARKLESKAAYVRPVEEFVEMIQRAYGKYLRNAGAGDAWLPNIVEVQFEEFVREPACRSRLLDALGIPAGTIVVDKAKFDPEVSGRNAGIHETFAGREDIKILADLATHFAYSKKGAVTL